MRPLTESDKEWLAKWIADDPFHKALDVDFFFTPHSTSVVHDETFVVKYSTALRVDVQFNPEASKHEIGKTLLRALIDAIRQAKEQGFSQILFDSHCESLIKFCSRFGFRPSPEEHVLTL